MEVRTNSRFYKKLKNIGKLQEEITITLDENIETPVMMIKNEEGKLVEYLRGFNVVNNFLRYGYNRIIRKCPIRHRKCIGEKCAWYFVDNLTGDCAMIWQIFGGRQ